MNQYTELDFVLYTSTNSKIQCFTVFPASK